VVKIAEKSFRSVVAGKNMFFFHLKPPWKI
jgi:hypothetical protein